MALHATFKWVSFYLSFRTDFRLGLISIAKSFISVFKELNVLWYLSLPGANRAILLGSHCKAMHTDRLLCYMSLPLRVFCLVLE